MRSTLLRIVCVLGSLLLVASAVLAQQVNVAQASGQVTDNTRGDSRRNSTDD